jgi:hypothetical protein
MTTAIDSNTDLATGLIPLLKEYSAKVAAVIAELRQISLRAIRTDSRMDEGRARQYRLSRIQQLREQFQRLRPAANDLIRRASQLVEYGNVAEPVNIELRLRLAEFEGDVIAADKMLNDARLLLKT